ncbi:senescence-associated carboxylesterase 101 [Cannabis sativa]|uniref:senescence-associated carboxylesterase 101 n=1 Tax=Cannabis sativa TaxID=3483 RepID=UPI0029C9BCE7|nr:senescence-associated carboxylesterase 101 [Cannabis sativa]
MNQCLFSSGSEMANLVVGSDFPQQSWKKIMELSNGISSSFQGLKFEKYQVGKFTIIAFATSPSFAKEKLQQGSNLVPSSSPTVKESFDLFESLTQKTHFSINEAAITLFNQYLKELSQLKNKIDPSMPLIVTGCSLGGSIASLFTLLLLESGIFTKDRDKRKLLCITFGSPLIGDSFLQNTLAKFSWNSYFLHLVSDKDPVPRIFKDLKPFGTFLLCSESGCSCFEDPETISHLLVETAPSQEAANRNPFQEMQHLFDYEKILNRLRSKAFCKLNSDADSASNPFKASIITQLSAIGITTTQPQHDNQLKIDELAEKMEKQQRKFLMGRNKSLIMLKKLPAIKKYMAQIEWYKYWAKDKEIGYYDSYKKKLFKADMDVEEFRKKLTNYWIDMVEEEEKKPHKGLFGSKRFLFAATNYRRMVEPLHIAKYYKKDGRNYEEEGRDRHLILLEQWQKGSKEQKNTPNDKKKKLINDSLTEDSCFWAKVEESILICRLLKETESSSVEEKKSCKEKLKLFEDYVFDLLKNYAVSPEIFLKGSSFSLWWKDYKEVMGRNYNSPLTNFMNTHKYEDYAKGNF